MELDETFYSVLERHPWEQIQESILAKGPADVARALGKSKIGLEDFKALLSPAADSFLEIMAQKSRLLTQKRFGRTIQMYAPLYLSNLCTNICTYCGFSADNKLPRKVLSPEEIRQEAVILKNLGFEHVLLVTGESERKVGLDYLKSAVTQLRAYFAHISLEVQPLGEKEYRELSQAGVNTVLLYQETYRESTYRLHHPKGLKSFFRRRLETPEKIGRAGVHKLGLGALIGLEDWRADAFYTALHLTFLEKMFWQLRFSISFPRLRPYSITEPGSGLAGLIEPQSLMTDRELVRLICAFRIFNENVELSLSTREEQRFRDHLVPLGVTTFSAGSRTNPGGYAAGEESLEQFSISDSRGPAEVAEAIRKMGYFPVWKDWDKVLS